MELVSSACWTLRACFCTTGQPFYTIANCCLLYLIRKRNNFIAAEYWRIRFQIFYLFFKKKKNAGFHKAPPFKHLKVNSRNHFSTTHPHTCRINIKVERCESSKTHFLSVTYSIFRRQTLPDCYIEHFTVLSTKKYFHSLVNAITVSKQCGNPKGNGNYVWSKFTYNVMLLLN